MDDFEKEMKEYEQQKQEYLKNCKPERYIIHDMGIGFIVQDTLAHKLDRTNEQDFKLIPEMNKGYGKDDKFKSAQDLIDTLNELDYQVNGNLYNKEDYWVLNIKERLYHELKFKLNESLNNFTGYDELKFKIAHYIGGVYDTIEELEIKVTITDNTHSSNNIFPEEKSHHPIFDAIFNQKVWEVIDDYLEEVERESDHEDMIREDTLIELKTRLLAKLGGVMDVGDES